MKKRSTYLILIGLLLIGFFSRFLLAEKSFYAIDSVLYTIATFDYSIAEGTPPAPGYFLYIMAGKFLNLFLNNPHDSMVWVGAIYSGLIAAVLFLFGRVLFSIAAGLIASLLFLTSPVFWYKGVTIYGYLNAGFFILLTVLFCYRVICGNRKSIYWASFFYAVLVGVRPQELPMLILPFIFAMSYVSAKAKLRAIGIFIVTCLAWFIPLAAISGGVLELLEILRSRGGYLIDNSIFGGPPITQINNHLIRMGQYFQRAYFLGIIPLFYYTGRFFRLPQLYDNKKVQFFALWIFPVLLFNVFIQFAEIGHGMCWGLGLLLFIGEAIIVLSKDLVDLAGKLFKFLADKTIELTRYVCSVIVLSVMAVNIFMFFHDFNFSMFDYNSSVYDDRQFNYTDLKKVDDYLMLKTTYIKDNFDTDKVLIIISNRFLYQMLYAFPESKVIQSNRLYRNNHNGISYCFQTKCIVDDDKNYFEIPEGISTVIVFDDIFIPYVGVDDNCRIMNVHDSLNILAIDLAKRKRVNFQYHLIELE